jgi:hypothetical protein
LVEQHPDEECERIGVEQPIRVAVSRDCERALHDVPAYGSVLPGIERVSTSVVAARALVEAMISEAG